METNKTLATYIALGAVLLIVLGLLIGGLVWACGGGGALTLAAVSGGAFKIRSS